MRMVRNLLRVGFLSLVLIPHAYATTDGSGWKIVAQMTSLLRTVNEQLTQYKEMLDIEKQLNKMESVKALKETGSLANDLNDLFREMETTIDHFDYDPEEGISGVKRDIDDLINRYEYAKGREDTLEMLKGYGRLLKSIENLSVLKAFHLDQMKKMTKEGINEQEAVRQTAYTNSLATQLMIEQSLKDQEAKLKRTSHATEDVLYMKRMGAVYGAMADRNKKEGEL